MPRRENPLDDEDGAVSRFALDLRKLRELSGSPTYRQLSRRAHYSPAALSEAANGRKLPSLAVTTAYVEACGGNVAAWEKRWRAVTSDLAEANPRIEPESIDGRAPYIGLTAFQPDDADRFFGRARLVRELVAKVDEHRLVVVFGASGSGKSSVLRAGLVASSLARDHPVIVCAPSPRPVQELAIQIAAFSGRGASSLAAEFASYPENLHLRVRQALLERKVNGDLLLVVDQFEEVFTLCHDEAERSAFIDALTYAAKSDTSRTRIVLGVRADFLAHCGQHTELAEALRSCHQLVGPMTADELREAIVEPAVTVGCKVETALVTRLMSDAAAQPAVLPLVSHALLETWHRRRGLALTLSGYEEVGGVQHAIARTAEQVYLALDTDQQYAAKQVFLRLIAVGEGTEDTKRRIARDEVDHPEVLAKLADARLVALDRDSVELAHEALIRSWPRLGAWIAEDRDGLRVRRALTEAAQGWASLDRDPGALYRGTRLALAREWVTGRRAELTARESDFLDTSIAADGAVHRLARRRTRRLRQLVALLAVLLVLASTATVYAVRAERSATEQRDIALVRQVIDDAAAIRDTNPALSLQLTLAAHRLAPLPEALNALSSTFGKPFAALLDGVSSAAFSTEGRLLATAKATSGFVATLWDASDLRHPIELATLVDGNRTATELAFVHGGRVVVSMNSDGTMTFWDISDRAQTRIAARVPAEPSQAVWMVVAPGGRSMATSNVDGVVQLWDIADLGNITKSATVNVRLDAQLGYYPAAFDATGRLAVGSANGTIRIWDVSDPANIGEPTTFSGHTAAISSLAFSPDGRTLAMTSGQQTGRLWNVADPARPTLAAELGTRAGHTSALDFSPQGDRLVTVGPDAVRVWDVVDPARPVEKAVLPTYPGGVWTAAFSADGRGLFTGNGSGGRLDDLDDLPVATLGAKPMAVAVDPTGKLMATIDVAGRIDLWDVARPHHLRWVAWFDGRPTAGFPLTFGFDGGTFAFARREGGIQLVDVANPDVPTLLSTVPAEAGEFLALGAGGRLLAESADRKVHLWNVEDPARPHEVAAWENHHPSVVAFDPAGRTVITGDTGGGLRSRLLDDPVRSARIGSLALDGDSPSRVAFSSDGRSAAGIGQDVVGLWDVSDLPNVREPVVWPKSGRDAGVAALAVDRGARTVALGFVDGTVRLIDVTDPKRPREKMTFTAHTGNIVSLAFTPDGRSLISLGDDLAVRRWDTDPDQVADRICDVALPRISAEEWERYFPGLDYQPPCGS